MNRDEWIVNLDHFATLALPIETARKYFGDYDVDSALEEPDNYGITDDGRVCIELTQIEKGKELYTGDEPTAHELLEYWEVDSKVLGEDGVEWLGWCDG